MQELLPLTWYVESPIDFEYKEYILYAYLQKVDNSFRDKILSPHLLHLERIIDELYGFKARMKQIKETFDRNRYVYFDNVKLKGEDNELINEINELVEFAIPQFQPRIDYGYKILKRNKQILF